MQHRGAMAGDAGQRVAGQRSALSAVAQFLGRGIGSAADGVAQAFCHIRDDADLGRLEPGLAVAPPRLSLQSSIHLRQTTGHPVLLAEGGEKFSGFAARLRSSGACRRPA